MKTGTTATRIGRDLLAGQRTLPLMTLTGDSLRRRLVRSARAITTGSGRPFPCVATFTTVMDLRAARRLAPGWMISLLGGPMMTCMMRGLPCLRRVLMTRICLHDLLSVVRALLPGVTICLRMIVVRTGSIPLVFFFSFFFSLGFYDCVLLWPEILHGDTLVIFVYFLPCHLDDSVNDLCHCILVRCICRYQTFSNIQLLVRIRSNLVWMHACGAVD